MKRQILRMVAGTAIAGAGVLAFAAPAQAQISWGNSGFLSGNQVSNVTQVPISVCGNAIAVFGFASASCQGGAYAVNYNSYRIRNNGGGGPASWIFSRTLS